MPANPSVAIRLGMVGDDEVKATLAAVGEAGEASATRAANAYARASKDIEDALARQEKAAKQVQAIIGGANDNGGRYVGQQDAQAPSRRSRPSWAVRTKLVALRHPITAWRLVRLNMTVAVFLRIGPDAANIMLWPEVSPATRLWMADMNRLLDGVSLVLFAVGFALCGLSGPIIHYQLSRKPIPYNLWPKPRQIGRGLWLTALLLFISLGVTVFRP